MRKFLALLLILFALPAHASVLIDESWESGWGTWEHPYGEADIVEDGTAPSGTHSLRYTLSSGNLGGNSPDIVSKSFTRSNEIWGSVQIKVSSNYEWPPIEDKLIFLWTGTNNACITLYSGNMLSFLSQPTGEWLPSQRWNAPYGSLTKGQWATIKFQAVINTAGVANGTMKVWLNDVLVINTTSVPWRSSSGLAFGSMALENVFGGPPGTRQSGPYYSWFDRVIIGTTSADIGEGGGGGDTSKPYASQWSPAKSATGVAISNRTITFHIQDDSEVLTSYGTVTIEGTPYTCGSGITCIGNGTTDATITYTKGSDWDYSQTVNVSTSGFRDTAGNVMNTDTWSYTTAAAPTPFPVSRVQYASNEGIPASATFGATPTDNNLLVAIAANRGGVSHADFVISGTGWTKRIGRDTELADSAARRSLAVWTKTAGAAEPTNVQVSGSGSQYRLLIEEFDADGVTDEVWTFKEQASNDTGTGSTSPLSSGTTASVSTDNLAIITAAMWRNQNTTTPSGISWTNDIGGTVNSLGGNQQLSLSSGFLATDTGGTKASSVSWTGSGLESSAGIMVFSVASADPASEDPDPLEITTSSPLASGTVGDAYSQTLSATGGTSPYTWAVTVGTLPAGLSLSASGAITGTPTTAGVSAFTVEATDSVSATDTQALSITIAAAAPGGQTTVLGEGINDTYINSGSAGTNYGDNAALRVYQWPIGTVANRVIVVDNTDIQSIPDNVSITSATMRLYLTGYDDSGGTNPMRVHAKSISGTLPDPATVTWTSFDGTLSSDLDVEDVTLVSGWFEWNVLSAVQAAYAARAPVYIALDGGSDGSADTNRIFAAMDHGTEGWRPQLTITYMQLVGPGGPSISAPGKARVSKILGTFR